ncbi:MAG: hypothetical protein QME25_08135 [Bacteroidota bacterium]|nr:hypothetical protein [Bacteroidota bacterium]
MTNLSTILRIVDSWNGCRRQYRTLNDELPIPHRSPLEVYPDRVGTHCSTRK